MLSESDEGGGFSRYAFFLQIQLRKQRIALFLFMSLGTSLIFMPFLAKKIGGIILSVMLTGQTIAAWNLFTDARDDTPRSY
jgi:hypothetical protein